MSQHCDDSVNGKVWEFCEENLLNGAMRLHDSPRDFEYQGPIRLDDALEMYAGRQTETLQSEIKTLKAQLAHSESIRHAEKRILLTEIRMRAASEAKVRELRELLSSIQLVASAPWTSQSWMTFRKLIDEAALRSAPPGAHPSALIADVAQSTPDRSPSRGVTGKEHLATNQEVAALGKQPSAVSAEEAQDNWERVCADDGFHFLKHACHDIFELLSEGQISIGKAAQLITERKLGLTSQLPSEWGKSSQALRDSTQHVHDENMQTDAGEERKDYVQSSDAATQRTVSETNTSAEAGSQKCSESLASGLASEQVPAARIPNAAQAEGNSGSSSSTGRASVAQTEGSGFESQDERSAGKYSPPRSEWISVEERLPQVGEFVLVVIGNVVQKMPANLTEEGWEWLDESADYAPKKVVTHWAKIPLFTPAPPSPAREKEPDEAS